MKQMTSRERLLTALDGGIPDRVPASVHQWQPYHLRKYLGGISDIAAFRRFGLDASLGRLPMIERPDRNWQIETRNLDAPAGETRVQTIITTPGGKLDYTLGSNEITGFITTHLVKRQEDVELIDRYMPTPRLDREALQRDFNEMGEDGIMRSGVWGDQAGPWQHAVCLMGTTEMIMAATDSPGWVHEFLEVLWNKKEKWIRENLDGAAVDLVETGGGAASSTVISPKFFREFCLPYDRKMHDLLHSLGHRVVYHTCGGMMPILELIVETGCDAAETLTPKSMGGDARAEEMKERIGRDVALIGGLDQSAVLETGTRDSIFQHVHEMFDAYGPNGGYIMSPSDHFFHVPPENLQAYADAAKECVY
jgi:uroporphyrinogen-III decarboxylase